MKKIIAIVLCITLMISLLTSCNTTSKEKESNMLKFNLGSEPGSIDPAYNGSLSGSYVITETFEGLTREINQRIHPGIAKKWNFSDDNKTVTFHLRQSKWSDGSPLTANDFVYAWKRSMDPNTASSYADIWLFTHIVGVEDFIKGLTDFDQVGIKAIDDLTLEIKLNQPNDYLLSMLSSSIFMPVKESIILQATGGTWAKVPESAISNGPFKLKEYKENSHIKLEKNPNYWDSEHVKLEELLLYFIVDEMTALTAFNNGEVLAIPNVPKNMIPQLEAENKHFYSFPMLGTLYFDFNLRSDLWADKRIREAVNLAIDREKIVDTLGNNEQAASSLVPIGFKETNGNDFNTMAAAYKLTNSDEGITKAKTLLAQAGFPNGEGFPEFEIFYNTKDSNQQIAEMLQEMLLTNLGLKTKLVQQEWKTYLVSRNERHFDFSKGSWIADFQDPISILGIFVSDHAKNASGYSNTAYDQLINMANTTTGQEHFELLHQAEKFLMEDLPLVPIYHYNDTWLIHDDIIGWSMTGSGIIDFSRAEIISSSDQ